MNVVYIFSLLLAIFVAPLSPAAISCEEAVGGTYLEPSSEDWSRATTEIQNFTPERMSDASQALISKIDKVLGAYRNGEISLRTATSLLFRQENLIGTGFVLRHSQCYRKITEPIAPHELDEYILQCRRGNRTRPYGGKSAGQVQIVEPNYHPSLNRWDSDFRTINEDFLAIVAEELYHVGQILQVQDPTKLKTPEVLFNEQVSMIISNRTLKLLERWPELKKDPDLIELDVFSKLLETLGHQHMLPSFGDFYHIRSLLQNDWSPDELVAYRGIKIVDGKVDIPRFFTPVRGPLAKFPVDPHALKDIIVRQKDGLRLDGNVVSLSTQISIATMFSDTTYSGGVGLLFKLRIPPNAVSMNKFAGAASGQSFDHGALHGFEYENEVIVPKPFPSDYLEEILEVVPSGSSKNLSPKVPDSLNYPFAIRRWSRGLDGRILSEEINPPQRLPIFYEQGQIP